MLVASDSSERENWAEAVKVKAKYARNKMQLRLNRFANKPVKCVLFMLTSKIICSKLFVSEFNCGAKVENS